jgi:hypothetical protein
MWAVSARLVALGRDRVSIVEAVFVTAVVNPGRHPVVARLHRDVPVARGLRSRFGVGTDEALAFSILMHAVWYVLTLLVGGGLLLRRSPDAAGGAAKARSRRGGRRWVRSPRRRSSGLALSRGARARWRSTSSLRAASRSSWADPTRHALVLMDESLTALEIQWSQ